MAEPKRRVLLVDDDPSMRKIFSRHLEVAGFSVTNAADGEEALVAARRQPPELIILDVMLPKLNGYEVCQQLKQDPATKEIPVIMFTAKGYPEERLTGFMFGANAYLSKTCQAKELLDQVKQLLAHE